MLHRKEVDGEGQPEREGSNGGVRRGGKGRGGTQVRQGSSNGLRFEAKRLGADSGSSDGNSLFHLLLRANNNCTRPPFKLPGKLIRSHRRMDSLVGPTGSKGTIPWPCHWEAPTVNNTCAWASVKTVVQ